MKLTLQAQPLPTVDQAAVLEATMGAFNTAADWLAGEAFVRKTTNKIALQNLYYAELCQRFGLSAQMAVRCIAQVFDILPTAVEKLRRFHGMIPLIHP